MEFIYFLIFWGVLIIAAGIWGHHVTQKLDREAGR